MQKVTLSTTSAVPFSMQSAQIPSASDVMEANASTISTIYCTDCGPNGSPDDGASTTADD